MSQLLYQRNDESGYEAGFWSTRLNEGLEFAVRWERGGYRANGSRGEVTILVDNEQVGHSRCCLDDPWSLVTGFELAFGRAERGWEGAGKFATSAPQPVLDYMLRSYGDVVFGGIPRPFGLSEGFWSDCRVQFLAEVCGVYGGSNDVPSCPRKTYIPVTWKPTAADLTEIKKWYGKDANDVLAEIYHAGYRAVGWAEPNEENCIRWWNHGYAKPYSPYETWHSPRLKVVKK